MSLVKYNRIDSLGGEVQIPPSKSVSHRLIIGSALSGDVCEIKNIIKSQDIIATISVLEALGAKCNYDDNTCTLTVDGTKIGTAKSAVADCGESGSTVRFMIPVAAALGVDTLFTGHGLLPERPLDIFYDLLTAHGVSVSGKKLPMSISGRLQSGVYELPGNISSQFITGLLLALPLLDGDSEIRLTTVLESRAYVDITIEALKGFGIDIKESADGFFIKGNSKYVKNNTYSEGDWSQAAFFLNMAAFSGKPISIKGLNKSSTQGDMSCVEIYKSFGVDIAWQGGLLVAQNKNADKPFSALKAQNIDASQIPDLVPAISICAALSEGTTKIYNAERLKLKESNRLAAMANAINSIGGKASVTDDGLIITGVERIVGGTAQGENDHRVLMALSAAALKSENAVMVTDAESVRKSYPDFYKDYNKLGGKADVNMG